MITKNTRPIKTYSELSKIKTFEDRFIYLKLDGSVGTDTFGHDRYMNQKFYKSKEWKRVRDHVIVRDNGCDLGILDREIHGKIYIHHMNPIEPKDIIHSTEYLLDPNYLICVSHETHNAIHYGDSSYSKKNVYEERKPNDTKLWSKKL